jgi:asparagine synthase (glutamine-hydrolysing)
MVKEMCHSLKHGGPDDEGFYSDAANNLVLGHRRLALIDLSPGGHQPMPYANERYWISYNGELYNYPEIKTELLDAGYTFKSSSDTEVILAAFAAWGSNAFRRFNGMFAFALWDAEKTELYLVRDASGIKPLYFTANDKGLVFASEIRAFAAVPWLQQANNNWPVYLLAYGHLPEPVTTLKEVRPLPKGTFLRYQANTQSWDIESFAFYSFVEKIKDRQEAIGLINDCLQHAVKRHLLSDAPIGVFLSGGIDSGIMAVLAARHHQETLKTLSIDFEESKFSEKKYQDFFLKQLNCPNWQQVLTEKEFQKHFPAILKAMDMPGCDGINTWFISKAAKESGLKAVLSGLGGDELFGGYPSFRRMKMLNTAAHLPDFLLRSGRFSRKKIMRRLGYLGMHDSKGSYLLLRGQFIPVDIAQQLDATEKEVWDILEQQPLLHNIHSLSSQNQAGWLETNMYMQNQLLRDSDVMSMAHGIEIRVPFLDKEFVTLAMKIASDIKYAGNQPKQLLIDSFKNDLPNEIWNRPKMGFTFPFAEWLGKNELVREGMQGGGKKGMSNYEQFKKGEMHWSQLMSLLLLNVRKEG